MPGVVEVFHAAFGDHAYPAHTHAAWTLLVVDAGAVRYELDRRRHGALRGLVTLLPPHVPHDGRATPGAEVDRPAIADPVLRARVSALHRTLAQPGEELRRRADSR